LATGASDHCPLILTRQERAPRKAIFKFENHWLRINGFREVVQAAWNKQQLGSAHTVLRKKLAETARALRGWSKPLFSNARLQLHIANEVIFRLDIAQENRQLSNEEMTLRQDLKVVGVVPNSLQDIGRVSDGAKRRPVDAEGWAGYWNS
jgi:hypothetical protein